MTDMKPAFDATRAKGQAQNREIRDTFTVRDMNRQPQAVLNSARELGRVHIQGRSGERFLIQPVLVAEAARSTREDFRARLVALHLRMRGDGSEGFTGEGWDTFSEIIAGE